MNKSRLISGFRSIVSASAVLFFVLFFAVGAFAASTIGANLSTTGTFTVTPATDSATSVQFQNTAGTNIFIVNSTSRWVGVGAAPQTTFEVQGTASASYLLTANTIQVGGFASAAYNRFGTATTTHTADITTTNDLLISGDLEVNGATFLDGLASVSSNFEAVGYASASTGFFTNAIIGSNVASSSTIYTAEFGKPTVGTSSYMFANGANSASTTGTCFQLKSTSGAWIYMRFNQGDTTPTLSTIKCHQ